MKEKVILVAVLSFMLLVPASFILAQSFTSQKGLSTVFFNVPEGQIKLYLPDDIRPGDHISGKIIAAPAGKNKKQSTVSREALQQYSIKIYNQTISFTTLPDSFGLIIPAGKPLPCRIALINSSGTSLQRITVPSLPESQKQERKNSFTIPTHVLTDAPLCITGPFDGDAANTKCSIGSIPVQILAESPRQSIVAIPQQAGGIQTISIRENNSAPFSRQFTGVDMIVSAGTMNLTRGQQTYIDITVNHLENLPDTAYLRVANLSGDIITVSGGHTFSLPLHPAVNAPNGTYHQRFAVQSIRTGEFSVSTGLDLPDSEAVPVLYDFSTKEKLRIAVDGGDVAIGYDGRFQDTKKGEGEHIHVLGNTIRIFLKGVYENEFDLMNAGEKTIQEILTGFLNPDYPKSGGGCDSMTLLCNKNKALNVFWGDVYSVYQGKGTAQTINGAQRESGSQYSVLITRGWELDCCTGAYQLKLHFQAAADKGEEESYFVSFSKILNTDKPCIVNCEPCLKNCAEEKAKIEKLKKEAARAQQ